MLRIVKNLFRNETVTMVSFLLAVVSVIFVPFDKEYLDYINYKTLGTLLTLMTIMSGLSGQGFFRSIAKKLLGKVTSLRTLGLVLVLLCFFFAMFITNDVSLITFVPFTVEVLMMADEKKYIIPIIVLQTIAANLGSMLTPIGNPHNLYLYDLMDMQPAEFMRMMLPYSVLSLILLTVVTCIVTGKESVSVTDREDDRFGHGSPVKTRIYLILFVFSLTIILKLIPYYIVLGVVLATVLIIDRKNLLEVDYFLLLTFTFLFIFIGNIKRVDVINDFLMKIVRGNEFSVSLATSQFISNVPTSVLISGMTTDLKSVCIGSDFGGLGTIIASLASLISFKLYGRVPGNRKGRYILSFSLFSLLFLAFLVTEYIIIN